MSTAMSSNEPPEVMIMTKSTDSKFPNETAIVQLTTKITGERSVVVEIGTGKPQKVPAVLADCFRKGARYAIGFNPFYPSGHPARYNGLPLGMHPFACEVLKTATRQALAS